jgi:hypothetical protein
MRRLTVELDRHWLRGQGVADHHRLGARMEHERGVHVVEQPGFQLGNLAALAFLARRADDPQRARQAGKRPAQRCGGAQAAGRDEVVAAAVTHPGQRVVFEQVGDHRPARPGLPDERGVQPRDGRLHLEALGGQPRLEHSRRPVLLQRELGVGVQVKAQFPQTARDIADRLLDLGMDALLISHGSLSIIALSRRGGRLESAGGGLPEDGRDSHRRDHH